MSEPNPASAAALYLSLRTSREPFLKKARESAALTLPFLIPPTENASPGSEYPVPYQSVGARGVVNLASRLLLSLLPPNSIFFKLTVDALELKKIENADDRLKTKLETALSEIEQAALVEVETSKSRVSANEAFQHLIVAGNALLEVPSSGNIKVYRLDRFVVQRDPMGNVLTIVIHETIAPVMLDEEVQKQLGKDATAKTVDLYTVCKREGGKWKVWQEAKDIRLTDSEGTYPEDKCPFIPLRFTKIDGEDYGRGFVEQYLGDLNSLEVLTQALVMGSVAASKVIFMVRPNGLTDAAQLAKANNGDFVPGEKDDVSALQLDKFADFQVAKAEKDAIESRLKEAFMLLAGAQRNAERVTAEEIRAMIQELETSLGGVYSVLAQDFQLPFANALLTRMAKDKRLPTLPKKIVRPTVTTGLEALGRGNDLQKLRAFIGEMTQLFGPETTARYVNPGEYFARSAAALGINTKGLVRSDEEVAAEAQQQQQQLAAQALTEKVAPAVAKPVVEQLAGQTQQ